MAQPKPLTRQMEQEFAKSNAARRPVDTRRCWCLDAECRWRDTDKPCPSRTDARDGVMLFAP